MNSVPKLFSCYYADCWTENHFSTEFGVSTLNRTHSHTLFWGCVSRWFGRALAWHARGQRFDPAILHQKSTVLRRKYGAFLFLCRKKWGLHCLACIDFRCFAGGSVQPPVIGASAGQKVPVQLTISSICPNTSSICRTSVNWVRARSRLWPGRAVWK